jgi:hypothetical protein
MKMQRTFFTVAAIVIITMSSAPFITFAQTATTTIPTSTVTTTTSVTSSDPNAGVAAAVASYFGDIPVMIAIAKCESGPRQFQSPGVPLHGGNGSMIGIFQLDQTIHTAPALALGFDINTVEGNMSYARYLYGIEGTEPWISSFGCWNVSDAATTTPTGTTTVASGTPLLTEDLSLGDIDPQVLILQQMLNKDRFTLALSGPGSPGNETTKFGALTWAALKSFQCAQGIACSGEEATTGYGYLNAPTRAALNTFSVSTTTPALATTSTTTASTTVATSTDDPIETAEMQSRVTALLTIVAQLEAEIAARAATH